MRGIIFSATLLVLLLALSLPSLADVHLDYSFPELVWVDQEKEGFALMDRGEEVGEVNVWIKEIEYFDQTAYMIEYMEESEGYSEHTITKVSGIGLKPLAVSKRIVIGDEVWFYEGNYTGDQIELSYTTPEHPFKERMTMSGSIDFYPAEILPYMLRNIQFSTGDLYTFTLMNVEAMHFQSAIVEVMGDEIVEVPSGIYDCWKVEIRQGGVTYEAWYSKKPPHYLIKYYFGKEIGMKNHT